MAGIDGLDVMERTGPYRDPRAAFGRKPGVPGNIGAPASPYRIPTGIATEIGAAPVSQANPAGAAPARIPVGQATEISMAKVDPAVAQATRARIQSIGQPSAGIAGPVVGATEGAAPALSRGAAFAAKAATAIPGIAGGIVPALANAAYRAGDPTTSTPIPARDPGAARVPGTNDIIPRDPNLPASYPLPPSPPGDVFRDTEIGRNVFNTVNAIPGIGRLPGAMLRAGSTAARALGIGGEAVRGAAMSNVLAGAGEASSVQQQGIAARPPIPAGISTAGAGRGFVNPPVVQPDATPAQAPVDNSLDITRGMPNASAISPSLEAELSAARMAAAGREDRAPGIGGFGTSAVDERTKRNADFDRKSILSDLESATRLSTRSGERKAAMAAYARLAGGFNQDANQQGIADINNAGQNTRSAATNQTSIARERMGNALTARGQDIGALTHSNTNKTSLDVARIGADARKSAAELAADSRTAAAEARATKFIHVPGGQEMQDIGGLPQLVRRPDRVFDNTTGQFVDAAPAAAAVPPPPKVGDVVKHPSGSFKFKGGDPGKPTSWEKV